jgi:hypothetical protein
MIKRKLLFVKRHRGTFLFAFANFKTQECYEWFFQFSLKDPWLLPKYDPYYLNGKWPLAGWLFFYFGRHTRGAVIPCRQCDIGEGKKPVIDKAGNMYMIYNLPDEELARKFRQTILRYNCDVEIEKDGDNVTVINRVRSKRWISIFLKK